MGGEPGIDSHVHDTMNADTKKIDFKCHACKDSEIPVK